MRKYSTTMIDEDKPLLANVLDFLEDIVNNPNPDLIKIIKTANHLSIRLKRKLDIDEQMSMVKAISKANK